MFAFIRVNFTNSPTANLWSDAIANAFMDPAIPFSMAHYWKTTTFAQVDMSYVLFPPITIARPQPTPPAMAWLSNDEFRAALTKAVFNELHRASNPDWSSFDRCIIFCAPPGTDESGGGLVFTPGETFVVTSVFSSTSTFGIAAQEVGHALGLQHERDASGLVEYGCPYSVMSARRDRAFFRPFDARLPGTTAPSDPSRTCGPLIPAAHLYINERRTVNPYAAINHADSVTYVSVDYAESPQRVRLVARDIAMAAWPARQPFLVVIPPIMPAGDTYFLELRRADTGYDQGIGGPVVVVLAGNFFNGSTAVSDTSTILLKYQGVLDLTSGDLDFQSADRGFVAQIQSVAADFGAVDLLIRSGGGPGSFGVRLGEPVETRTRVAASGWTTVEVSACRSYPKRPYAYRTTTFSTHQAFTARSLGYQRPRYRWYINDVEVASGPGVTTVSARCERFDLGKVSAASTESITCATSVSDNTMEFTVTEAFYDMDLTVRVVVSEATVPPGASVPERAAMVTAQCGNVDPEWDSAFQADRAACLREAIEMESGIAISGTRGPGGISARAIQKDLLHMLGIGIPGPELPGG